jgi:hypothetical protein
MGAFVMEWKERYNTVGLKEGDDMSVELFGYFGLYLHNVLFANWSHSAFDSDRPAVRVPEEFISRWRYALAEDGTTKPIRIFYYPY